MVRYLYHGSGKKLKYLVPKKPVGDDDPKHSMKAIYATSKKKFALAMAASRSSADVSAFNNRKTNQQNIVEGWPDEKATVYLYVLDIEDFEQNHKDEWIAKKRVVPVRVEEYKVKDLRHLYRRSNKAELKEWLKDRDGWVSPDEKLLSRLKNKFKHMRFWK